MRFDQVLQQCMAIAELLVPEEKPCSWQVSAKEMQFGGGAVKGQITNMFDQLLPLFVNKMNGTHEPLDCLIASLSFRNV